MSLDSWLPPVAVRPKASAVFVEEKCAKCGLKISAVEPKYVLRVKGKVEPYHQGCAKAVLPHKEPAAEVTEESQEENSETL